MSAPMQVPGDVDQGDAYREMVALWESMSRADRRRLRDFLGGWTAAMTEISHYAQCAGGAA